MSQVELAHDKHCLLCLLFFSSYVTHHSLQNLVSSTYELDHSFLAKHSHPFYFCRIKKCLEDRPFKLGTTLPKAPKKLHSTQVHKIVYRKGHSHELSSLALPFPAVWPNTEIRESSVCLLRNENSINALITLLGRRKGDSDREIMT